MSKLHAETINTARVYTDLSETPYDVGDLGYAENGDLCIFLEVDGNTAFAYATGLINPVTKTFICQGTTANDLRKVLDVGVAPANLESTVADGYYCWIIKNTGPGHCTSIDNRGSVRGAMEQLVPASHSTTTSCQELITADSASVTTYFEFANLGKVICYTAGTAANTYAYVILKNGLL